MMWISLASTRLLAMSALSGKLKDTASMCAHAFSPTLITRLVSVIHRKLCKHFYASVLIMEYISSATRSTPIRYMIRVQHFRGLHQCFRLILRVSSTRISYTSSTQGSPRYARNGETPDPNTKTAPQLEAVEPHMIVRIAIFFFSLVERYIDVNQYIAL
jgi:hypothetical protein